MTMRLAEPSVSSVAFSSLNPFSSRQDLGAGQDRDVLQHGLAAVAEAGRLDGGHAERAPQLVDDEGRERLAVDVLGDNEEGLAGLGDLLQHGEEIFHGRDLLVVDQDHGVLQDHLHVVGVGHEVGAEVAAVELHALDGVERRVGPLGLLDGDHAVLADLLHRLGDQVADLVVVVGRDGADLGDLLLATDFAGQLLEPRHDLGHGLVDAALEVHRVGAGVDRAEALVHDRLGEHGGRRGAVTGDVRGLRGDLLDHLGADVGDLVLELDLLGDGHAVLGDGRGAELLLDDDVAALRPQGHLDGVGERVDALLELVAGVRVECDLL